MVLDTTLYDRLEISCDASENDIKKAFNKLSKIWHPDKCNETDKEKATKKFQELTQAKEILLDTQKRELYHKIGMNIFNENYNETPFSGFQNFDSFFSGGFPFSNHTRNNNEKFVDIIGKVKVSLEQIYNEETISYTYEQNNYCQTCNGEGNKTGKPNICNVCNGKGVHVQVIRLGSLIQQSMGNCHTCNGTGKLKNDIDKCLSCNGICFIKKSKTIQIPLKNGLTHNNKVSFANKGNQYKNKKTDLIIIIKELQHPYFKRIENDLYFKIKLNLYEALFGFNKIIEHLDGRKLNIIYNNKLDFNSVIKIPNEGILYLNSNMKGNLFIIIDIILPNLLNIDNKIKLELNNIFNDTKYNNSLIQDNTNLENTISTKLELCNIDISNNIINKLNNCNENNNDDEDYNANNNYNHTNDCRQS